MVRRLSRRNYRSKRVKSGRSRSLRKRVRSKSVRKIRRRKSRRMRGGEVIRLPYNPNQGHSTAYLKDFPWGVCNDAVEEGEKDSDKNGDTVECVKLRSIPGWKNKMIRYNNPDLFIQGGKTLIWKGTGENLFGPTESNAPPPASAHSFLAAKRAARAATAPPKEETFGFGVGFDEEEEVPVVEEVEDFGFGEAFDEEKEVPAVVEVPVDEEEAFGFGD